MNTQQTIRIHIGLVLVGSFFFAAKVVVAKYAYRYNVEALTLLTLRMLFTLPLAALIAWAASRKAAYKLKVKDWFHIAALSFIGYYVTAYMDFVGMQYISTGLERMLINLYPTFAVLFAAVYAKERITRKVIAALLICYAGIALLFMEEASFSGENILLGTALCTGAAFFFGIFIVLSRPMIVKVGSLRFTGISMCVSSTCAITHQGLSTSQSIIGLSDEVYALAVLLAIGCTVIPAVLMNRGVQILGSTKVSLLGNFGPVSTAWLGAAVLDEPLTQMMLLGMGLVLCGCAVIALPSRKKTKDIKTKDLGRACSP